jgi:hypothetical protein
MDSIGFADSGGFELNTGGHDGTLQSGIGDTGGFELNTQDSPGGNGDMNNTGFADSGGFQLDTADGNTTFFDSNQTGFADSGGFNIDTRHPNSMDSIGFSDSGGFELNTGGHDGTERTGFSDSGGFSLNTVDAYGSTSDQNSTGFADSSGFDLDTTDSGNQQNQNAPPSFQSDGNLTVPENSTFVYEFNATDPNGDYLTYSILYGDDANAFDLNGSTGILSFISPRDYESPDDNNSDNISEATIQVSDGNTTDILNLFVHVTDMFENDAPSFQSDGNLSVYENQTFVYEFNATDPDGDDLTYSILYGPDASLFDLNQSSGSLTFFSPKDYEAPEDNNTDNFYQLTIQVADSGAPVSLNLNIEVTDVFENAPPSFQSDGNLTASENTAFVYEFNATDPDGDVLTYSILYGPDASLFDLNQSSGSLTFFSPKDYEAPEDNNTDNVYQLTIQVADSGAPVSLNLNIEVTDVFENAPPSFQSDGNLTVSENTAFVYEFNATDPDGDVLTYSILYGPDASLFDLNQSSGSLTFFSPKDYEAPEDNNTDNVYQLTIQVAGIGTPVSLNLNIEVTDVFENAPPSFQSDGNLTVSENTAFVYEFNATDPDGDSLSYSILHGPDASLFDLNQSSGALTLITPKNYEIPEDNNTDNVYQLTIQVTDSGAPVSLNLNIEVTDAFENSPPSFQSDGNLTVSENTSFFVYEFNATDPDGDNLSYSILHGPDASLFDLNQSSGALTLITPKDFEAPEDNNTDNIYQLTIQVADNGAPVLLNLNIEVTDVFENAPPSFQSDGNLTVSENTAFVYEFNATDPDGDVLTYSILYGPDASLFDLNQSSGSLTFFSPKDYEAPGDNNTDNFYQLTIQVAGNGAPVSLNLNIEVTDIFENSAPSFQSDGNLNIPENTTFIYEFNATDPNGDSLSYSIEHGDDQQFFELNSSMGTLSFITPKDFENPEDNNRDNVYELSLIVSDDFHTAPLNLFVQVTDIFEADFDSFDPLQIEENSPVGSLVGHFDAINIEPHEAFSYSLLSFDENPLHIQDRIMELEALSLDVLKSQEEIGAYQVEIIELQERIELAKFNGLFFVDQNGSLRTNQVLDYEAFYEHPFLPILVQATDEHNFTITKHFMIEVTDEQFEPDFDTFGLLQIEVNRPVGSLVGQFNASNIEPHEFFSYSVLSFEDDPVQILERILELETLSLDVLISPEEIDAYQVEIIELQERIELAKSNGLFFVDQNGSLRTNQVLDYEAFYEHPFLPILVQATDEHNFTITKYFMVEVIDRVTEPVTPLPAIVRTFNSADINEFSYLLEAEVLADGGSLIQEAGFLISKSIRFIDPIRIIALLDPLTGEFSAEFVDFEPGTRYYFRGYAFNDFGESKGSIKKFRTPEIVDPDAWWNNMTDVGGGWRNSEWFGAFLTYPELDWIYHSDLDWVYVVKDEGNGIWIWHPQHGWLWTQDMVWPYLYSNRTSNWIYFMNKFNGQPIFYDYETGRYLLDFKSPTDI